MKTIRLFVSAFLLALSLCAVFWFDALSRPFLALSPDGSVTAYMLLLLRLLMISSGALSLCLLFYESLFGLLNRLDYYLSKIGGRKFIFYSLGVALLLRLSVVMVMPLNLWADYASYDELGWTWAQLGGYYNGEYLTAYWPPGYSFLLSRLYLIFGHSPNIAVYLNIFLGGTVPILTYQIIGHVWDERTARWTAIILVFFPSQLFMTNLLASEMLFIPLLLTSIYFFLLSNNSSSKAIIYALFGGILLGTATLTRSIAKYLLPILSIPWLFNSKKLRSSLLLVLAAAVGFAVVVSPWMIRNKGAMGAAIINSNTGINLYMGNQPTSGMGYNSKLADQFDINDPKQELYIDSVTTSKAIEYILDEPLAFVKRGIIKLSFFYAVDMDGLDYGLLKAATEDKWNIYVWLAILTESFYLVVLLFSLLGIVLAFSVNKKLRSPGGWMILGIILYWSAVHFVVYGMGRYHQPIIPMLSAFAAVFIVHRLNCQNDNCLIKR